MEKLENHSLHEKLRRLRACVSKLKERKFKKIEYEEEEALAGKMSFLYERENPPPSQRGMFRTIAPQR